MSTHSIAKKNFLNGKSHTILIGHHGMMKSWLLGYSILDESLMLDWCVLDYIFDNT